MYTSLIALNPECEEQDEIYEYKNLSNWYNKTMKSCDAYQSIKKYEAMYKSQISGKINNNSQ